MKKLAISFISALLIMIFAIPAGAATVISDYKGLEDKLDGQFSYYDKGSAEVKDLQTFTTNQMDQEGNVVGEIQVDVMFVEFKEVRDTIFFYTGHEIYYYDATNKQYIDTTSIQITDDIAAFQAKYMDETGKHFNTSSMVLYMVLLSTIIIIPILIALFHNTGRSYITNFYRSANISQ